MRISYVMEMGGLAGGHKLIFEHLTRLTRRGHATKLYFVQHPHTNWFPLEVGEIETCGDYTKLMERLHYEQGIKVATWWRTAAPVQYSGGGCYYIQDVETSYAAHPGEAQQISMSYGLPLRKYTESRWVAAQIPGTTHVGVGIDRRYFYPALEIGHSREVLFHERDHFLKGPELRREVVQGLQGSVDFVGYSPWMSHHHEWKHLHSPTDAQLGERMRHALCLLVTSKHEGFCLPAAEAMACGLPVVTTPADGNDFCVHGENALLGTTAAELKVWIQQLQSDFGLWAHLRDGGIETAKQWDWDQVIDRVEAFLGG